MAALILHVSRIDKRVHLLEGLSHPQIEAHLDKAFASKTAVAITLLLEESAEQGALSRAVTRATRQNVAQTTVSRHLRSLKSNGILGRTTSRVYFVEESWKDAGIMEYLRRRGKVMGLAVARRRS